MPAVQVYYSCICLFGKFPFMLNPSGRQIQTSESGTQLFLLYAQALRFSAALSPRSGSRDTELFFIMRLMFRLGIAPLFVMLPGQNQM